MTQRDPEEPEADGEVDDVEEIIEELAEHPDVPEADVIEQHQSLVPPARRDVRLRPDVPEADALEQAEPVEDDDEFFDE
jgi:hypothetical protein